MRPVFSGDVAEVANDSEARGYARGVADGLERAAKMLEDFADAQDGAAKLMSERSFNADEQRERALLLHRIATRIRALVKP